MNKTFLKSASFLGKIAVAFILVYFTSGLLVAKTKENLFFGICLLFFITLPTIFVVYFKSTVVAKYPKFVPWWKVLRVFYVLSLVLLVAMVSVGLYRVYEKNKTEKAIELINSKKITLDDVMGKNLPPVPDQAKNDSTIAGIDANNNFIRDDVELAIFEKYPNSAKIRSAMLQYAQALQLELTQVFNSATLKVVMQKESRGIDCIGQTGPEVSLKDSTEKIKSALEVTDNMQKEVESLVVNTSLRTKTQLDNLAKYMVGYSSPPGNECDIELSLLPK